MYEQLLIMTLELREVQMGRMEVLVGNGNNPLVDEERLRNGNNPLADEERLMLLRVKMTSF